MASGNIWELYQSMDVTPKDRLNGGIRRVRSWTPTRKLAGPKMTIDPKEIQKLNENPHKLRRVKSLIIKHKPPHKNATTIPSTQLSAHFSREDPKRKSWRDKSIRKAKEKGIQMLKKATKKAGEILAAQDSVEDEEEAPGKPVHVEAAMETGVGSAETAENEDNLSYFDARSEVTFFTPECRSGVGTVLSPVLEIRPDNLDHVLKSKLSEIEKTQTPEEIEEAPVVRMRKKVFVYDPNCPIHGANRDPFFSSIRMRRKSSPAPSLESFNYSISESEYPILASQAYAAKIARKRKRAQMSGPQKDRVHKEMAKIRSNLFVISVAFLFLFTAFQGLQNLQSTVNAASGLGPISLAVVYFGLACSSLFFPPYMLNRLGCKLTLIMSICMYALYMLVHFVPQWYSLLPVSFLLGVAAASLWSAKCTYLAETGVRYAVLNVESPNVVIVRFFGIFFMIVHTGQVFGNLISSTILQAATESDSVLLDRVEESCGHFYNETGPYSAYARDNLARPAQRAYAAVCAAYVCCAVVSALIIGAFLNTLKRDEDQSHEKPRFKCEVWHTTIRHLRNPKDLLLIPLTIFNGMEQAFIAGEFTKAYVGCCLGIGRIGYVLTSFGVADALCSLVFGPLIRLFGRMPLFMFGAVVDMLMIFTLLIWPPNPADTAIFYVVAAAWGMADGVWNTQINGLWVVLFGQNLEVAFANYRLWESVGFTVGFALTPFLSTEVKLYILLSVLLTGMVGYGLIEVWEPLESHLRQVHFASVELLRFRSPQGRTKLSTTSQEVPEEKTTY